MTTNRDVIEIRSADFFRSRGGWTEAEVAELAAACLPREEAATLLAEIRRPILAGRAVLIGASRSLAQRLGLNVYQEPRATSRTIDELPDDARLILIGSAADLLDIEALWWVPAPFRRGFVLALPTEGAGVYTEERLIGVRRAIRELLDIRSEIG